jgi:Domain of unknown function (DUF4113)
MIRMIFTFGVHHRISQSKDRLNRKMGAEIISFGVVSKGQSWRTKSDRRSGRFTTRWDELASVKAGFNFGYDPCAVRLGSRPFG